MENIASFPSASLEAGWYAYVSLTLGQMLSLDKIMDNNCVVLSIGTGLVFMVLNLTITFNQVKLKTWKPFKKCNIIMILKLHTKRKSIET